MPAGAGPQEPPRMLHDVADASFPDHGSAEGPVPGHHGNGAGPSGQTREHGKRLLGNTTHANPSLVTGPVHLGRPESRMMPVPVVGGKRRADRGFSGSRGAGREPARDAAGEGHDG